MKHTNKNVAIYWGAFNPPTLAHSKVVQEVLAQTDISHIILSPSGEREDKDFWIEHENRRKLIQIFLKLLQDSGAKVSLDTHFFEWNNAGITTTSEEEAYFRKKLWFSPAFIFWSDTAANMHWWSNNEDRFIEEKLKKIFIARPGTHFDFEANGFSEYLLLDIPNMLDISSSLAREMIQHKQSVAWILDPKIIHEIEKNHLYQ